MMATWYVARIATWMVIDPWGRIVGVVTALGLLLASMKG